MRHRGLAAATLVAAVLVVYHAVGRHEFVDFDDFIHIVHNASLKQGFGLDALVRAFTTPYGITANWIPLSALSLQLDYTLYGEAAAGYHLTNVALHATSTLLLFLALSRMTGSVWRSAFAAGVFALHPVQVESVAWASERKGLLCALWWMATLASYVHYTAKPAARLRYAGVLVCLSAALLSKPMAVTLPFALLLLDYWPLRRLGASSEDPMPRGEPLQRALLEKIPMLALVAGASAVTMAVQSAAGAGTFGERISVAARLANAAESYGAYLVDFVWPAGLAVFYPHPYLDLFGSAWPAVAWGALLIAATALALRAARLRPHLTIGWLWFLGTLVPVIGLVPVGLAARADRYLYLPIVGLAIALAWGAAELARNDRRRELALAGCGAAILVALAATSWLQLQHWRSTISLFEHAAAVTDGNFLAHHRLATAKLFGGRADEAEAHYRESIRSGPPRADAYAGLGDLLAESGRLAEAVDLYRQALELEPDSGRLHTKMGFALLLSERFEEARPHLARAANTLGPSTELHVGLAMAGAGSGDLASAVRHYRAALQLNPGLLSAADKLAWILATSEDASLLSPAQALELAEVVNTARSNARTLDTLAAAQAASGRFEDAVASAREAERLAEQAGHAELSAAIGERVLFYESGRPFIDWNSRAIH